MKRLFLQIFAWLAILLGVGLMLQPTVSRYLTEQKSTKTVQKFVQVAEAAAPAAPETSAAEPARAYPELYDAFLAYNQQLFAQGQSGLKDPFAYETPAFDLTGCGLPDDVIAALWIPRLDLELPVYLGANATNMARGGALLGQDLPPYVIVRNDTLRFAGINKIGLARRGFSHERIAEIHDACRILFQSGLNYLNGCDEVEKQVPQSPERDTLLEFIRTSKRGIIKPYESRCKEE